MTYDFKPKGVCSKQITIQTDGNIIEDVVFYGGCSGNSQGIAALVKGMNIDEVINKLQGIKCGYKKTSCPDQLSIALQEILNK